MNAALEGCGLCARRFWLAVMLGGGAGGAGMVAHRLLRVGNSTVVSVAEVVASRGLHPYLHTDSWACHIHRALVWLWSGTLPAAGRLWLDNFPAAVPQFCTQPPLQSWLAELCSVGHGCL